MHTIDRTVLDLRQRSSRYRGLHRLIVRAVDWLSIWYHRSRERQALLSLDDHMLRDIGLSSADVWDEARKPFWRE